MLSLVALGLLAGQAVASVPTISAKGSKFFTSDGNQFYLKGIAYQLTNDDPLATPAQCALDAALMKTIGTNSIRVYHVDPTANHDECMSTFEDAGIYIWLDLDTFSTYIQGPGMDEPTWNSTQYEKYQEVMDAFHNYDNLGGFFVGNEVLTTGASSPAAPYVKAAGRDMKAYRNSKGYRKIPIGYTAADVSVLRPMLQNYLACGSNSSESLDFFGLNAYEWCGDATYEVSGYQFLQQNASEYDIPIFFSETGCNTPKPRTFDDQDAIFGDEMSGTWSGAIIYEWIQEANDYGLVSYGPSAAATATDAIDGYTRSGTPTPISPDWTNLSKHWATLSPSGVKESEYTPSLSPPPCPGYTSGAWEVSSNAPLPTLGQALAQNSGSATTGSSGSSGQASATGSSSGAGATGSSGSSGNAASATTSGSSAASSSSAARALALTSFETPYLVMAVCMLACTSLGIFLL